MGYWTKDMTTDQWVLPGSPEEKTGLVWGDEPADIMSEAVEEIVKTFQRDIGRKPTKAEMFEGLKFCTNVYDDNMEDDDE